MVSHLRHFYCFMGYNFSEVNLKCCSMLSLPLADKNKYLLSLKILVKEVFQKKKLCHVCANECDYGQKCRQKLGSMISDDVRCPFDVKNVNKRG